MKIKVGILGLGHIGYYHIKALKRFPEFDITAACDSNSEYKAIIPEGVVFYNDTNAFIKDDTYEVIIIATPNATHYKLGCDVFKAGKNVIMEKPAAVTMQEFDKLDTMFNSTETQHIYYAFHAARAFDVTWFNEYLSENRDKLGPVTAFFCSFYDPYIINGKLKREAAGLQNSWIDSGVNALSVLETVMDIKELKLESAAKTKLKDNATEIQATVRFSFPVIGNKKAGMGVINTNWALGLNEKKTHLSFGLTGHMAELNHSAQTVVLTDPEGKPEFRKDFSPLGERLENHYIGVFRDYIECFHKSKFNCKSARSIYEKFFLV